MGGVRLRRITRLLPRHGWEPIVLTHPRAPDSPYGPEPGICVEEVAAPDLARIYEQLRGWGRRPPPASVRPELTAKTIGLTSAINRWLMIPDKQITWYRAAVRKGRELLRRHPVAAIFASLDPRTCCLVASRLSRESGVPCVVEYRDLWTGNPYGHLTQATGLHRWLHGRLERKVLRHARRVTAVCQGIADYLAQTYPGQLQVPVALNYNFFDPEEYPPLAPEDRAGGPFTISYTGAMYASRRPHTFFEGMRRFIDQSGLTPEQFRFCWAGGAVGINDLAEVLDRTGVRPYLQFLGQLPHREALRQLMLSQAALLIQAPQDHIHIPGKLSEALGARVPLLALTHPCETAAIIDRCRAGIVCPHTGESVAAALGELHRRFLQGARWDFCEAEVQRFSAATAIGRLAALFEEATR